MTEFERGYEAGRKAALAELSRKAFFAPLLGLKKKRVYSLTPERRERKNARDRQRYKEKRGLEKVRKWTRRGHG